MLRAWRQMERRCRAVARHAQRPDLCAHRRNRRGGDDFVAGKIGGVRNWDYRLLLAARCDLHAFALTRAGFVEEARSWRGWLLRAIAGSPAQMQILYGMHGERRLPEFEIEWLAGYENSRPVRVGNAASNQFQLDVYGEVMSSMYHAQQAGIKIEETDWAMQRALMKFLESHWQEPDEGIWEVRGGRKISPIRK